MPMSAKKEPPEVREAAVEALKDLHAPGVCQKLLELAKTETGNLRQMAFSGIVDTAMPEAIGDLLKTIGESDAELAGKAKHAFEIVRDSAKSADLFPLLDDPADNVRREIVEALSKRGGDGYAAKGITKALKDKIPEIRLLAVKAVPVTSISPIDTMVEVLGALVTDSSEEVQLANAETLAQLSDEESRKVILEAFGKSLKGRTLEAYITALGRRSYGKDLKAVGIVVPFLNKPTLENSVREALMLLTLNNQPGRDAQRRAWTAQKWKDWYAKIMERESKKDAALAKLQEIDQQKQGDKGEYARLMKETDVQLKVLEKCEEMCDPDDPEDKAYFDDKLHKYTEMRYLFQKSQTLDLHKQSGG